jgi:hypothetical protein
MSRDIKWMPNVCECVIMQDRFKPEEDYEFASKCEKHESLEDVAARKAIITMCIEASVEQEINGN